MASPAVSRIACVKPASARALPEEVLVGVDIGGVAGAWGDGVDSVDEGNRQLAHADGQVAGLVGSLENRGQIGMRTTARLEPPKA